MAIDITQDEVVPTASNLVYDGLTLFPTFHIEVEVFVTEQNTVNDWTSLLHFTIGDDYGSPGDRTPGEIINHNNIKKINIFSAIFSSPEKYCPLRILAQWKYQLQL